MTVRSDERQFANVSANHGGTNLHEKTPQIADPEMAFIIREVVKGALTYMAYIS